MSDWIAVAALLVSTAGIAIAYLSLKHSRESALAAQASAQEAKRANNLQIESIREAKQAKLRFLDDPFIEIIEGDLNFHFDIANMGLGAAYNVRFFTTVGEQFVNTINKNYQGVTLESVQSGEHRTVTNRVPDGDFRHFTGRVVVELVYDDLEKADNLVQRNCFMDGSHESGVYTISYR